MIRPLALFIVIIVTIACPAFGSLEKITLFVWNELEPLTGETLDGSLLPETEIARRILEETRVLVSAMIYGFEFRYVPSDAKRNVREEFELVPIKEIPWGDARLAIVASERKGNILHATVTYALDDYQAARVSAWKSASMRSDAGMGEGSVYKGYTERLTSFRNSIKEAIRNHMRAKLFNKPREISGDVLLSKSPSIMINAGKYLTTSNVKINIRNVIPYIVF
jgi:hypothetical protein